jgi:hypothetical protein
MDQVSTSPKGDAYLEYAKDYHFFTFLIFFYRVFFTSKKYALNRVKYLITGILLIGLGKLGKDKTLSEMYTTRRTRSRGLHLKL